MAGSRREMTMDFVMNAQLNGGFSSTVGKAQQEFARLGKEIQSLSRAQSDISAYQKQQAAMENTGRKLEGLKNQQALLRTELDASRRALEANKSAKDQDAERTATLEKETAALERESAKLEQRIVDTTAAFERQQQKVSDTGDRLRQAGVDTNNLSEESARLSNEMRELKDRQEEAARGAQTFGERGAQAFGDIQQAIAAAGIAAAMKEIADAYRACVEVSAEFEASMSNVEALSGATDAEMTDLTATAKTLGATTVFTAQQSADAMGYMAMAGWNAQQMMAGMSGVIDLAAASGEDLALVSDIVTDNLTAFGLTAADTGRFADVLAAAATNSNTSVSIMGETFKNSASIAGALGYSIEDVAVATGLMANAGVKGSIAGTALRNVFNGLLEGVTLTSTAFGDYEYSAIKADGTMKSFSDTIAELRVYFDQMTEAERVNNAMAVAGQRGYNGLLAILNATDEDFASLTNSINECSGAASRMADIKLDNLKGDLTLLDSAWSALKTTIGEEFNPELRNTTQLATEVLTKVDEFAQENPGLVKGVMAFTGAIGVATGGVMALSAATKLFAALNIGALFTGPAGLVLAGVAGVAALTAAVVGLTASAEDSVPPVKELTEAAREMEDVMGQAGDAYGQTAEDVQAAADVADIYIAKLEEMGEYADLSDDEQKQYLNTLSLLCNAVPELAGYVDLETGAIEGGTEALRAHTEAWKKDAQEQARQDYLNELYSQYNDVMKEAAANSIKLTEAQIKLENAQKGRESAQTRMNELQAEMNAQLDAGKAATAEQAQEYNELEAALIAYNDEIYEAQEQVDAYSEAVDADNAAMAQAQAEFDAAAEAMDRLTGAADDQAEAQAELTAQTDALGNSISGAAAELRALAEEYEDAYNAAYESVSGQYALWDEAAEVASVSAGDINNALESQAAYWRDYNANLASLAERTDDIDGLREVIASFADGSAESVNAIAGMAKANDDDLAAMVKNWQDVQTEWATTSDSLAELQTDFDERMDEIVKGMEEDIDSMNFSDDAAKAARDTIQSYIGEAEVLLPEVERAYGDLARAARMALAPELPAKGGAGPTAVTVDGAYASGTDNAAPGIALVGEEGPELVRFKGGEQVVDAKQTIRLLESVAALTTPSAVPTEIAVLAGNAYASGTDNAAPGVALVGEEGPELVYLQGRGQGGIQAGAIMEQPVVPELPERRPLEPVYSETPVQISGGARTSSGSGASPWSGAETTAAASPINIQVTFQLSGSVQTEVVEQLRAYGDEIGGRIREVVEDVLDRREEELVRRRY